MTCIISLIILWSQFARLECNSNFIQFTLFDFSLIKQLICFLLVDLQSNPLGGRSLDLVWPFMPIIIKSWTAVVFYRIVLWMLKLKLDRSLNKHDHTCTDNWQNVRMWFAQFYAMKGVLVLGDLLIGKYRSSHKFVSRTRSG